MKKKSLALFLPVLVAVLVSCSAAYLPKVVIYKNGNPVARVNVEIADSPVLHSKGLMFRKKIPDDHGMWFVFERDSYNSFWMENTFISLDVIFVDKDNRIISVAKNAEPLSRDKINPAGPYRYVLEVPAGFAEKHQLNKNDIVRLE